MRQLRLYGVVFFRPHKKAYLYILYTDNLYRGVWHQICSGLMNPTRWLMLPGAYQLDTLYHNRIICGIFMCNIQRIIEHVE